MPGLYCVARGLPCLRVAQEILVRLIQTVPTYKRRRRREGGRRLSDTICSGSAAWAPDWSLKSGPPASPLALWSVHWLKCFHGVVSLSFFNKTVLTPLADPRESDPVAMCWNTFCKFCLSSEGRRGRHQCAFWKKKKSHLKRRFVFYPVR